MEISNASAQDLDDIRAMLREYVAWLDLDLTFQDFSHELATLPGAYAPPTGALIVARADADGDAIGMVALRRLDD
jgi:hypothetical protein